MALCFKDEETIVDLSVMSMKCLFYSMSGQLNV